MQAGEGCSLMLEYLLSLGSSSENDGHPAGGTPCSEASLDTRILPNQLSLTGAWSRVRMATLLKVVIGSQEIA